VRGVPQVLAEFAPELKVTSENLQGHAMRRQFAELLPRRRRGFWGLDNAPCGTFLTGTTHEHTSIISRALYCSFVEAFTDIIGINAQERASCGTRVLRSNEWLSQYLPEWNARF